MALHVASSSAIDHLFNLGVGLRVGMDILAVVCMESHSIVAHSSRCSGVGSCQRSDQ
jgi:hypothetical protein